MSEHRDGGGDDDDARRRRECATHGDTDATARR
jgi:hypothetical protein